MIRIAALLLGCVAFAASASTTYVNPLGGGNGSERCLGGYQCAGGSYDGALSLIGIFEKDLGFAPGSFARVDDAQDRIWANVPDGGGEVQALARYADDRLRLGYDAGGGYAGLTGGVSDGKVRVNHPASWFGDTHAEDLVNVTDSWITIALAAGEPFAFILDNLTMGYLISSDSGLDGLDYMVTWRVPDALPHYFIAWEDRNPLQGHMGDQDYNDLVIEVRYANPVPEPRTYALLLAGLGLMGFVARRRRATRSSTATARR